MNQYYQGDSKMAGLIYEQPESRKISGSGNSLRGERVIKVKKGTFISEPEIGTEWPEGRFKIYYNELLMVNNEAYTTYTLFYSKIKNKYIRSTIKAAVVNVPYTEHEDYRTCWEYILAATSPEYQSELPEWYETNDDGTSPDDNYKWILSVAAAGNNLYVVDGGMEKQKFGRTFEENSPVVSETYYFTTPDSPDAFARITGRLKAPRNCHGLLDDNKHWRIIAAPTSEEGSFFLSNPVFKYKGYTDKDGKIQGWDTDIYKEWDN